MQLDPSVRRRLMLLPLALLLCGEALADPTVPASPSTVPAGMVAFGLPVGQAEEGWTEFLSSRGMVANRAAAAAPSGPTVVLMDKTDHWEMTVRDWSGNVQTVNIPPAISPEEREDLLFYAQSLLGTPPVVAAPPPVIVAPPIVAPPVAVKPVAPPVAVKPVVPPAPAPIVASPVAPPVAPPPILAPPVAAKPVAPPPPVIVAPPVAPPPVAAKPVAPPAPAPVVVAPPVAAKPTKPAASGSGPWIAAGGGVGVRSEAGTVGDVRVEGGWRLSPSLQIGAGLGVRTPAALVAAGEGRTMGDLDLVAQAAWLAPMKIAPLFGAYLGVASRSFTDGGVALMSAVVPIAGAEVALLVPLGSSGLALEPSMRVQADLRAIELRAAGGSQALSRLETRAGVLLAWRP